MHSLKTKQDQIGLGLVILTITIIGASIRLFYVLRADFPLNDGGMFFQMTQELYENHLRLPFFTEYNHLTIPYAYPPIGFYITAIFHAISDLDLVWFFQFLPVSFNFLTIPAFFLLSREILNDDYLAIHATLIFSILPPSYEWLIMGGGIARAPAFLFSMLALWLSAYSLKYHSRSALIFATIFLGLTVLSHLEIFMITVIWIGITAFFFSPNRFGVIALMILGLGSILISAPWWLTVISRHGFNPFLNAMSSGQFSLANGLGDLLLNNMTEEYLFTPVLVFGIIGLIYLIQKKNWFLPTWILAVIIFDTRSLERSILIPLSMVSAITIQEIILPAFTKDSDKQFIKKILFPNLVSALLIAYIFFRSSILSQAYLLTLDNTLDHLEINERNAMQWAKQNIPVGNSFLVLTAPVIWETWENSEVSEWFPVLSGNQSITTVQGTEWLSNDKFGLQKKIYQSSQLCALEETTDCLNDPSIIGRYSYILLSGKLADRASDVHFPLPIEAALIESPDYVLIYENEQVKIFSSNQ